MEKTSSVFWNECSLVEFLFQLQFLTVAVDHICRMNGVLVQSLSYIVVSAVDKILYRKGWLED